MDILETNNKHTIPIIPNYQKPQRCAGDRRGLPFEVHLKCAETQARKKFNVALKDLPDATMPEWLVRLLEGKIVPALERIGFDPELSRALFNMAAPAWERMGPIGPKTIYFHPALMRELADISQGSLNAARQKSEKQLLLATMNSGDRFQLVENSMDPRNLFHMLEDITTSWIILPRASVHLKEKHARWLPGYLECLEKEAGSEFEKTLIRIIIEYVGNFAHKFSLHLKPHEGIDDVLFYGYAAMFWKNLRSPPQGLESIRLFENFLRWARIFCKRLPSTSPDKSSVLTIMEKAKKNVLAGEHCRGLA